MCRSGSRPTNVVPATTSWDGRETAAGGQLLVGPNGPDDGLAAVRSIASLDRAGVAALPVSARATVPVMTSHLLMTGSPFRCVPSQTASVMRQHLHLRSGVIIPLLRSRPRYCLRLRRDAFADRCLLRIRSIDPQIQSYARIRIRPEIPSRKRYFVLIMPSDLCVVVDEMIAGIARHERSLTAMLMRARSFR
jgi:hypothetical protein